MIRMCVCFRSVCLLVVVSPYEMFSDMFCTCSKVGTYVVSAYSTCSAPVVYVCVSTYC